MVINNNELEFKGKSLQEYLEWKYPEKVDKEEVREIDIWEINEVRENVGIKKKLRESSIFRQELWGEELDLRKFKNLERIRVDGLNLLRSLTELNISGLVNLTSLSCCSNNLTSIDFLNHLPHPEKLIELTIYNNNFEPTDIEIFSRFVNLKELRMGTTKSIIEIRDKYGGGGKYNKFYGSLKSLQNLTKLESICIEATDVDSGLEYLPDSLVKMTIGGEYYHIECSSHGTSAKCSVIQDQLRPFNYDIEAWQLAHPHLMSKARPELFEQADTKTKWLQAIETKITETKTELETTKTNESDKTKRISRLESKLKLLENELRFLAQENEELRTSKEKLEIENAELKLQVSSLTQKLEQINLISQVEVLPK